MLLSYSETSKSKANTVAELRLSFEKRCSSLIIAFDQECMLNTLLYDLTKVNMDLIDCQDIFANSRNLFFGETIARGRTQL